MNANMLIRKLLSAKEAAEFLGVSERTLWEWTNKGTIKSIRIEGSRLVKYTLDDLNSTIERCRL